MIDRAGDVITITLTIQQARVIENAFDACLLLFLAAVIYAMAKNCG